jgi:AcrR family transcriptional regulator
MRVEEPTDTRGRILTAAERLTRERGLRGATTRAIAEMAGCAEGSIYRYFPDKHALFHEIVRAQFPEFFALMDSLPTRAGRGTVRKNLEEVAVAALGFHRGAIPMVVGAMGDRELLLEQRRHFAAGQRGPLKAIRSIASYLAGERRLGRISSRCAPAYVARMLLGTTFAQAALEELVGDEARIGPDQHFARDLVRNLIEGLQPDR